ncbi:helix-turn-helix domain-containing protein [Paenibacillus nasutitermitis]|uniref:HTH-type transcriptional regulator YtdP n=1 Tax=Paenibacillus nasutitermitis TaxID=1652958 RepID=A0A917E154_9BACL|nr:helix-turn-helix domain-containing protein [Paenibacillus nasutitermitis]GGD91723.1 putative HTH-type transcriptional regulator YtdP [Paenibacillus nasutitermitis]
MKKYASTFLSKLIWFSLLLGTFPVIVLGAYSYYTASHTLQAKVYESNLQLLQQTESQIEQLLRLVDYSAIQYMNQPLVISTLRENLQSDASGVDKVRDLLNAMSKLQSSQLVAMSTQLVSLTGNWSVSETGLSALSANDVKDYGKWVEDPRTSFWSSAPSGMQLVKKIPTFSAHPTGLLVMTIPLYEINKLIGSETKLGHVLIMDESKYVFAGNDDTSLGKRYDELPFRGQLANGSEEQGFYSAHLDNERVGVSYRLSSYNSWVYLSVVSIDELNKETQDIGWVTLLICVGILLIALFISYLGSKKMYRPIRRLYDVMRDASGVVGGAETANEFEFMNDRFHGLLQREGRLLQEMKGQSLQMKEYFVFKLFQSDMSRAEISDKLAMFVHPLDWSDMCVMAIQIDTLKGTRFEEQDRDLLMFALNNIVSELVAAECRLLPVVMGDSQVTLLGRAVSGEQPFKTYLDLLAQDIMSMINRYLELKISIGFSRVFTDLKSIREAYMEALTALKYRMKLGEESILFIEEVQPEHSVPQHYPDALEQQFLDALKLADRDQTAQLLSQLITAIAADERTYEAYFMSFVRLLLQILQTIKDTGVNPDTLYTSESDLFNQLFSLNTAGQVELFFEKTVILPLVQHLEQRRDKQYQSISSEIIRMIETEFDTDLTLEVCARRMNYSPNYLTKVFRKETGINFSDYLSEQRMRMAKKWLIETDMKIGEIAKKLKYNTPANFIRYFRKLEGCTPGQYRENYLNK